MRIKSIMWLVALALLLVFGVSISPGYAADFSETERLANQGDADAQYELGVLYEKGDGVEKNRTTAKVWYGQACDNGKFDGCRAAARLLSQGVK